MKRGILVYNQREQEWRVWIGQMCYWIQQGDTFELRIDNKYFNAYLEKDISEWTVTLNRAVVFTLNMNEVYKVRIKIHDYIPVNALF
ncbi:hypothetical protein D7X33_24855 [Butyricicoccus sp. 1XD8-22]|nr:hypothetical protein D7X33_24855 [Butyricicoccus sp. 1XD8-22]